jgi:deoxyribonuclease V
MSLPVTIPDLSTMVSMLLEQIPHGRVTTFGDIAEALGDLSAARWVAQELAERSTEPWHRVVKRTGEIVTTDPLRACEQRDRLLAEGIECSLEGKLNLQEYRWHDFQSDAPLRQLARWQDEVAAQAEAAPDIAVPPVIGGLDVSYVSDNEAVAAYVEIDTQTGATIFSATHRAVIVFPYITGYLTFRELPIHLELLLQVLEQKPLAKVILVDGAGQLHPRRSGIAVAVGVIGECVTVGVAKHHLCGRKTTEDDHPMIELRGEILGQMLHGDNRRHPLYVSPGHGLSLTSAVQCVRAVWPTHRSPLPIRAADQLSRKLAKENLSP